jgi:signal transduction histidine kinase
MRPLVDDEPGITTAVSLNFLLAAGAAGTLVFVYTFVGDAGPVSTVFPGGVIEFLLLGMPALGLLYAGYWLRSTAFTPAQVWGIGQYALGGALTAVVGATVVTALVPDWSIGPGHLLFLLTSTGVEGALIGVLAGTFAATDLLGRELDRLRGDDPGEGAAVAPSGPPDGGTDETPDHPESPADDPPGDDVDDLLAALSHDLRNPLNVARIRVQLAREEGDLDHLDPVVRSHDRMEAMIEDTLRLARATGTGLDVEPVDLRAIAEDCWRSVESGEAALVVETDLTLRADRTRLARLLENLFRNSVEHGSTSPRSQAPDDSVEHSSTGSRPPVGDNLTVRVGALDGGFYVADDGPGIPPDRREAVFETGYSTREAGTGLGLAIVSRIAEEHGWEVRVVESAGGGARFEITDI